MPELGKGGNTAVATGRLVVALHADGDVVDLSALLVAADGKVRSDDDIVFYNQPAAESDAVRHLAVDAEGPERVEVDPAGLPADVDRVVLVGSCDPDDASRTFHGVKQVTIRVEQPGAEPVVFHQPDLTDGERAVLLAEIYRRGAGWKLRAIGQGYANGLAGLATDYGIAVAEEVEPDVTEATGVAATAPPAVSNTPAPAPTPPPTTAPARANLRKLPLGDISLDKGGRAAIDLDKHDRELVVEAALEWDGGSEQRRQQGANLDLYALFVPATKALRGPKAPGTLVKADHKPEGEPLVQPDAAGADKAETTGRKKKSRGDVVYYKRLGSLEDHPHIRLDGDARAPGREFVRIVRPDAQGYVLLCAYSALSNGYGSFRSFGAKVVITDGRGSTVTVPLFENAKTRYWVALALIDFGSPRRGGHPPHRGVQRPQDRATPGPARGRHGRDERRPGGVQAAVAASRVRTAPAPPTPQPQPAPARSATSRTRAPPIGRTRAAINGGAVGTTPGPGVTPAAEPSAQVAGRGDHLHHRGQPAGGQGPALPVGAGALGEQPVGQTRHLTRVTGLLERGRDVREEVLHHVAGGTASAVRIDEVATEPVPGGLPHREPQQLGAGLRRRDPQLRFPHRGVDQRAHQSGEQHGLVRPQLHVQGAHLDRRVALVQPRLPVELAHVPDDAGVEQLPYAPRVVVLVGEARRHAADRPAAEDDRAPTAEAGVVAPPQRRVRRHRDEGGKPHPYPVQHLEAHPPAGDGDEHVHAVGWRGTGPRR